MTGITISIWFIICRSYKEQQFVEIKSIFCISIEINKKQRDEISQIWYNMLKYICLKMSFSHLSRKNHQTNWEKFEVMFLYLTWPGLFLVSAFIHKSQFWPDNRSIISIFLINTLPACFLFYSIHFDHWGYKVLSRF